MPMSEEEKLFHDLWGQAKDGRYVKQDWNKMHRYLLDLLSGKIHNGEVRNPSGKIIGRQG